MATFPLNGVQYAPNAGTDPAVVPMTVGTGVVVGTTATSIVTIPANGAPVLLVNSSSEPVYIGASDVTTTTGYEIADSAAVLVTYGPPSPQIGGASLALYGVTSTATSTVTAYTVTKWPGANLP
ncbi:hypothetical protein [Mycobacterium intracellulare]|uniref:hypothetical protein n=1 Tax=Mycobacterium intracellulare TaxID=1767 RepID=UPI00109E6AAC|nr:hypothetical protein [Mycobacterium intracellulare]